MAKTSGITHRDIIAEVGKGEFRPVYLLMGEESYYIDKLSDYISSKAVSEDEAAFNLITIYATKDMDSGAIVNAAKRYPMMSKYQVVIVKECQNVKNFDALNAYLAKPMTTTVLILCYKNGTMDRRKKTVSLVEASGVVFNSPRLKDGMLPSFISDYLRRKKVEIENQAMMMLVENIGSDLNRLAGELDKLCLTLPQGSTRITADDVERNIGISKNYNVWELKSAVISKDVMKANRIINYFCDNPKQGQPIMVVATLFSFFAGVMQAHHGGRHTLQFLCRGDAGVVCARQVGAGPDGAAGGAVFVRTPGLQGGDGQLFCGKDNADYRQAQGDRHEAEGSREGESLRCGCHA